MNTNTFQEVYCGSCGTHKPRYAFPDGELLPSGRTKCNSCNDRVKKQKSMSDSRRSKNRDAHTKLIRTNLDLYLRGLRNPK